MKETALLMSALLLIFQKKIVGCRFLTGTKIAYKKCSPVIWGCSFRTLLLFFWTVCFYYITFYSCTPLQLTTFIFFELYAFIIPQRTNLSTRHNCHILRFWLVSGHKSNPYLVWYVYLYVSAYVHRGQIKSIFFNFYLCPVSGQINPSFSIFTCIRT